MNHKHRTVLHTLFAHPISANIDPKHVKATLTELGAEVSHGGHGDVMVSFKGVAHRFREDHHSLSKDQVAAMRKFLTDAGVDPVRDYPI